MAKKKFDIDQGFHLLDEILTKLSSEDGSVQVTIFPGYTEQDGPGLENLSTAIADGNCDALMSAFHVST